jgi:hypothetical protein
MLQFLLEFIETGERPYNETFKAPIISNRSSFLPDCKPFLRWQSISVQPIPPFQIPPVVAPVGIPARSGYSIFKERVSKLLNTAYRGNLP